MATKFESIGVSIQNATSSKQEAIAEFQRSCRICNYRGIRVDCDRCAIANAHSLNLAAFAVIEGNT